jgi:diguanylate cyclase (GGDEF)-like protein
MSPGLVALYGVPAHQAMADPRCVLDRIVAADRAAYLSSVQASARELAPWSLDYRICHVDGSERWLRARATPSRRDNGDTVWDGVVVDITDQKDAEHGLRDANLVLQEEIAQRHAAEQERDALIAELQRLSDTDPLTGALNRRGFAAIVERELRRLRRSGGSVGLVLLDLDHFKRINDRFGHEAGDLALQRTAQACRATVREVDCVGRLGGEEFAILLHDADEQAAWLVAMRLRGELERLAINIDGLPVPVTASFGIVAKDGTEASLPQMLRAADAALYEAKAAGRNRVVRSSRLPAPIAGAGGDGPAALGMPAAL